MKKTNVEETLRCLLIWKHKLATTENLFIFNFINSSGDSFSVFAHIGLFTFPHFRNAERPERMGHNTRKSIGRVLCVVRRYWSINYYV